MLHTLSLSLAAWIFVLALAGLVAGAIAITDDELRPW